MVYGSDEQSGKFYYPWSGQCRRLTIDLLSEISKNNQLEFTMYFKIYKVLNHLGNKILGLVEYTLHYQDDWLKKMQASDKVNLFSTVFLFYCYQNQI